MSSFKERGFKRIVLYPEGTRLRNYRKLIESQEFAKKHNLPILNNVLYPRTKGFSIITKYFQENPGSIDCVYDITFGYEKGGISFWKLFSTPNCHIHAHVHIKRFEIKNLPQTVYYYLFHFFFFY